MQLKDVSMNYGIMPPLRPDSIPPSRCQPAMRLGLVGYSTRALAEAAYELGFTVSAVDAFCDQDLLDIAQCQLVCDWPHDIISCARRVDCDGWLLAGGMENHGRLVAQLGANGRVLGPTRAQLAHLRRVRLWRELADHVPGLAMPATSSVNHGLIRSERLFKPRKSSGGLYVMNAPAAHDASQLPRGYWQERIEGRVLGVTTLISDSGIQLLGATESLSANQWPGPRPYIYRGSIGPVQLSEEHCTAALMMAQRVGEQLHYRGYLQADFIEDLQGQLWLLELNPRWTAGMEVLHQCASAPDQSPLAAHCRALGIDVGLTGQPRRTSVTVFAKAILYAHRDLQVSPEQRRTLQGFRQRQTSREGTWWNIADVPALGSDETLTIPTGQPILTLRLGWTSHASEWTQSRQDLLVDLSRAREHLLRRVLGPV